MIAFNACGHRNVLSTHRATLEFTKDKGLTLKGDCIVGVNADFDLQELKKITKKDNKSERIKITIKVKKENKTLQDTVTAEPNPSFSSKTEMVIRKTGFISDRTFAINADKAAADIKREIIGELKKGEKTKAKIIIDSC